MAPVGDPKLMERVVNLAKRRGLVFPSSEIYGGFRSTWDFGPLGVLLKRNVKDAWWRSMVQLRDDIVGLDASILMSPKVWEASGHLATFTDPLVTTAFFWKLLSLEGFHPMLDGCARCGESPDEETADDEPTDDEIADDGERLVAFDLEEGGTVCRACARGGGRPLTPGGLALLRRVLGGGLNGALAETPGPAAHEVEHLGVRALEHHVERRLRSAVLL